MRSLDEPRRRHFSLLQLLLLNSLVCGLEFCVSAGFTYIPPMLLKAGVSEHLMSWTLGVGPLFGFFFVPLIGRASDRCHSPFGRRRPFIVALSAGVIISLLLIPYGELIGAYGGSPTLGILLLVLGVVVLDFSSQACLTPCEALLSDACRETDQRDRCFLIYSFMLNLGGCIGYLITALDWHSSTLFLGNQERTAFSLLVALFAVALCATLFVADEKPDEHQPNPSDLEPVSRLRVWLDVPIVLRRLALADFFSWSAVMGFNIFFTDFVGHAVYGGDPSAPEMSPERIRYDDGVRAGSWGLLLRCAIASVYSLALDHIICRWGVTRTYLFGMVSFTVSMLCMLFATRSIVLINLLAAASGLGFATLTSLPFTLVTVYHENKEVYFCDTRRRQESRGVGGDMAVLDAAYFLSQISLSLYFGPVVQITGSVMAYIAMAALLGAVASMLSVRVISDKRQMTEIIRAGKALAV